MLYYIIDEDYIHCTVKIYKSLNVSVKSFGKNVNIRDLLGYQCQLQKWSQLEAILNRAMNHQASCTDKATHFVKHQHKECFADDRLHFLLEQLLLLLTNLGNYSAVTMMIAVEMLLSSRSTYSTLRRVLCLPHPNTLKKKLGSINEIGSSSFAHETLKVLLDEMVGIQKSCVVLFDEIYVKPSIRLRGNHLIGYSEDEPKKAARTILAFMVRPLMGGKSTVVRLIPIFTLKADFLYNQLLCLLDIISEVGGRARAVICDCHATNQKCYKMLVNNFSNDHQKPWKIRSPSDSNSSLFLLFDPTHLIKNIRNNWITERQKELTLRSPVSDRLITGAWNDIISLYENEKNNIVKMTGLTYSACFPTTVERQNVSLVGKVFSEKVVAALALQGHASTAEVIGSILRMWKILNVKAPGLHIRLNDYDREEITKKDHKSLKYLEKISESIREMPAGRGRLRLKSLTYETRDALTQTLKGLVELSHVLLEDKTMRYILLGFFQSDRLEGEFGVYRQMSGGCYYVAVEQILASAKLRRLKLYNELELDFNNLPSSHSLDCCNSALTDSELMSMDACLLMDTDSLNNEEKAALFYISGYVAFKENIPPNNEQFEFENDSSEFTRLLSRGKLTFPPNDLLRFVSICYGYFKNCETRCVSRLARIFVELSYTNYDFNQNVCKRVVHTFLKGVVNKMSESLKSSKEGMQKIGKLH